ncbi:fructose-2,6-bisphosphatase [Azotobacter chroococcum subsp. isscasi]|uniref:histidine phosphatase family protein n=1 Tax=Azotobacter chroococcum TaxID=353 RepID=UPI0010401A81|nr:fructose-2,6-bisphosphatase [Azotobacter chroococcum]TBW10618.1 fructose-2,6-bisphosphatase [Azotobacter chroococcum subsp. isscasi]
MRIILVRHGRPEHSAARWCSPAQMKDWIARYNEADVAGDEMPDRLVALAAEAGTVACSSVARCVQSRAFLDVDCCLQPDPLFAEAHLPYLDWPFPRLPPSLWRLLFRSAWFCGFARHTEPIGESNRRAGAAAERLIQLAEAHGSVLLMGHGIMNVLIARQLRKRGWAGPLHLLMRGYWHASVYRKESSAPS